MTREELEAVFEAAINDRPINWTVNDIDGFMRLVLLGWTNPGSEVEGVFSRRHMLGAAERDMVWLSVDIDWLASVVTIDDINYLNDCGINYDSDYDSLYMHV